MVESAGAAPRVESLEGRAGDRKQVDLRTTSRPDDSISLAPVPPPAPAPTSPSPPTDDGTSGWTIAGWIGVGLGALAGGGAIGTGVAALGAQDTYFDSGFTDVPARDEAASLETATNVLWISAGVLVATGVASWIAGAASSPSSPETSAMIIRF